MIPATDAEAVLIARALRLDNFFPEFNGEVCGKLFPRSGVGLYEAGARLIEQGETGYDLFVIIEGAVSVTLSMGTAVAEVATLGPESVIGEIALLRDGTRTATATAISVSRAFRLAYEDMGYVLQNNPELSAHLKALAHQRTS
ncbi:MAG: cyclic nucleotide-binding domain-containing protein [Elusimicrobia bacterium]|nr:cyclic nucleotide-binding domain-containing protein [Elusimicrobiota bacterium]